MIVVAILLTYFFWSQYNIKPIYFNDGLINLNSKDISNDNFQLKGDFIFYPNQIVQTQADITTLENPELITIGSWNIKKSKKYNLTVSGTGTYHFKIICNKDEELGLDIGSINSAYNVWVNDKLIYSMGEIGYSKKDVLPKIQPKIISLENISDSLNVYISVANYHHAKAGIIQPLYISTYKNISNLRESAIVREMAIIAFIMAFAIYNCFLLFVGVNNYNYLVYALFCFFVSIRQSLFGSYILAILYDNMSYKRIEIIGYISLYFGFALAAKLVYDSNKKIFSLLFSRVYYSISILCLSVAFIFPGWWNYYISIGYYFISIIGLLYINLMLINQLKKKVLQTPLFLLGTFIAMIIFIHDILAMIEIIDAEYLEIYAILLVVAFQSIYLSYRYKITAGRLNYTSKDISKVGMISKMQEQQSKEIIDKLEDVLPRINEIEAKNSLKKIIQFIDNQFLHSEQKITLESIDTTNEEFLAKLKHKFPDLTHGEIELSGYIRADFSTKKIAEIKNITPQSVKKSKQRLRKKLKISPSQDIYEYIKSI